MYEVISVEKFRFQLVLNYKIYFKNKDEPGCSYDSHL